MMTDKTSTECSNYGRITVQVDERLQESRESIDVYTAALRTLAEPAR